MSQQIEQKIAEIRKSAEEARKTDRSWVDGQDYADDVEFLLDELEKITEQRDAYYKSAQFAEAAAHGIEKLREENRKMIEALQWYADEQNYDGSEFRLSETEKDTGQRARNILREIGVTVG